MSEIPSPSRSRKLRNAATKRQLYQKSCHLEFDMAKVESLIGLVQQLTLHLSSTLFQLPYIQQTSWFDTSSQNQQYGLSPWFPYAEDYEHSLDKCDIEGGRHKTNYCNWVPALKKDDLFSPGSIMQVQLEEEAAILLQKAVRHYSRRRATNCHADEDIPAQDMSDLMQRIDRLDEAKFEAFLAEFLPDGADDLQSAVISLTLERQEQLRTVLEDSMQASSDHSDEAGSVCGMCEQTPCICGEWFF